MLTLALLSITAASVVACHIIAARRGGNGVFWGVMGLLFGPFAIPFACFAKPQHPDREETAD